MNTKNENRNDLNFDPTGGLKEDIYNFLENISKNKNAVNNNYFANKKKNFRKFVFEEPQNLETIHEDKVKAAKIGDSKGLDDNIWNDFDTKSKARKGLLLLLNKMSNGSFCPEIKTYFDKINKEQVDTATNVPKDSKKIIDNNKNLRRQNYIEKFETIKDLKISDSIKDEDILKLNLRNNEKTNQMLNNKNPLHLNLRAKKNNKNDNKPDNYESKPLVKVYKNDLLDGNPELFYSDDEIDNNNNRKFVNIQNDRINSKRKTINENNSFKNMNSRDDFNPKESYHKGATMRRTIYENENS